MSNKLIREIKEGRQYQGEDESISYYFDTTPWGSGPTNVSVKAYSYNSNTQEYTDVTSTVLSGNPTVEGDTITLPLLHSLVDGTEYRIEVKFTVSGNIEEVYAWVEGQK